MLSAGVPVHVGFRDGPTGNELLEMDVLYGRIYDRPGIRSYIFGLSGRAIARILVRFFKETTYGNDCIESGK